MLDIHMSEAVIGIALNAAKVLISRTHRIIQIKGNKTPLAIAIRISCNRLTHIPPDSIIIVRPIVCAKI